MIYQLSVEVDGRKAEILDNDGKVVAEGRLVADYVEGQPESLIRCSLAFEGIHKRVQS